MDIRIDDNAGYCFGVVKAIGAAEDELSRNGSLYCLGDIVHNSAEVERLRRLGLVVIDHSRLSSLPGSKVLIRAHGEPPETYRTAQQLGIQLIDATCPIVLALQQRIRKGYDEMQRLGGQIVIFGKPGHAEVIGLTGQTGGTAIIASTPDDLSSIDFSRPIRLYSQTTKSREEYQQLIANISSRLAPGADFVAYDTICNRVANRARELEGFARSVDPVMPQEITITRLAITTEADAERKNTEMGKKYVVPYALYRVEGYVSANLARKTTGFSEEDLSLLWDAIMNMFEFDHAAARGKMATRELIIFKHDSEFGNAPAHKLFDLVKVEKKAGIETPRAYADYEVSVDTAALPAGVSCEIRS